MSLNHIDISGRLTADPVLRTTASGISVVSFTVAVDKDFAKEGASDKTDFFNCTAWDKKGQFIERNFRKGNLIIVSGRMQSRKWEDKNGNKQTSWDINVENVYFGGSKNDQAKSANVSADDFEDLDDNAGGDLPF